MSAKPFFDTNVLIYAFATGAKAAQAEHLLAQGGTASVQVFNEFANVCRRKLALEWREIDMRIGVLKALLGTPSPVTEATHDAARTLAKRYGLSFFDALIVASAREAGAVTLYSEDMQAGQKFGPLRIVNPFNAA